MHHENRDFKRVAHDVIIKIVDHIIFGSCYCTTLHHAINVTLSMATTGVWYCTTIAIYFYPYQNCFNKLFAAVSWLINNL